MDHNIPEFSSKDEEIQYWKELVNQLSQEVEDCREDSRQLEHELEEFQENSRQLEKELETSLEQSDKTIRDLRSRNNRLQLDNEGIRDKLEQTQRQNSTQISKLQSDVAKYQCQEEKLIKYIRELEQKNDDFERENRALKMTLKDREVNLNTAIERNALLEVEKDETTALVQRLKDESRDLAQEMKIRERVIPDNDKFMERIHSPIDSNKLKVEMETQTAPGSPLKTGHTAGGQGIPLTPPARISAMNIVGDLLRKVGSLESKLATCRNASRESPQPGDTPTKEPYRSRRLHRGTSSPSVHGYLRAQT